MPFRALVEPLGRELHAYAYRMLGGFHDADDVLRESRFKAWRALATDEPRASFRAWMYRIVINTCVDVLKARSRRVMPQDVGPSVAPGPPRPRREPTSCGPSRTPTRCSRRRRGLSKVARQREGIRLAFVRVVQVFPPRQRAALLLHDVLDWSVAEVAAILRGGARRRRRSLPKGRVRRLVWSLPHPAPRP